MFKSAILFALGRAIYAGSQWLVMIYLAKFSSTTVIGTYTFSLALCAPVIMFSQMNMRTFLITDSSNKYSINEYITTRILIATIAMFFILTYTYLYIDTDVKNVVYAVSIYKSIESIIDIFCAVFQKNSLIKLLSASNTLRGLSLLISISYTIFLGYDLEIALFCVVALWFLILLGHDYYYVNRAEKIYLTISIRKVFEIIRSCLPLGVIMSLLSLGFSMPVYFIKEFHGVEMVGIYSGIIYFLLVGRLITDSLIQTSLSKLAKLYNESKYKELRVIVLKLLTINFSVGIIFYLLSINYGDKILYFIYGEEFSKYNTVLEIIVLSSILNYLSQIFGVILTIKRRLYRMIFIHTIQVVVIFISCIYFVKEYGVIGGAYSTLIGFFTILVLNIGLLIIDGDIKKLVQAR